MLDRTGVNLNDFPGGNLSGQPGGKFTEFFHLVSTLKNCHEALLTAISQLSHTPRDEWIDNECARNILCKSNRTMQTLRSSGKIGYSIMEGKVFYPSAEIARLLNENYYSNET